MLIGYFIQKGFGNDALFIFAIILCSVAVAMALIHDEIVMHNTKSVNRFDGSEKESDSE